jgi:hypothetical protein
MAVYEDDASDYHADTHRNSVGAYTWLLPLLLIVIAFFTGWWANAFTTNNNSGSGFQPGVGGGPGNTNSVSPTPRSSIISPLASPTISVTLMPTPTIMQLTPTPTY